MPSSTAPPASTVLITGGNVGIGLATAVGIARTGAGIILAVRSVSKGAAAADHIRTCVQGASVDVMNLDLASLASIRSFVQAMRDRTPTLDVLVNNAGIALKKRTVTTDGFETTFGVNHLGHFLLTNLLHDQLAAAPSARVVVVASDAHRFARKGLNLDDLNREHRYGTMRAYGASKLANILFAREAARRWAGDGITVNSLHPGFVATRLGRDGDMGRIGNLAMILGKPFAKTPERGAQTSIYLATSSEVDGVTGQYFLNSKPKAPAATALDDDVARRLWGISAEMVGLTP